MAQKEAFEWGMSIGRVRYFNGEKIGDAKGTGLRGVERRAFEDGLKVGWSNAQAQSVSESIRQGRIRSFA
jgi:hypothetical protein